MGLHEMEDPEKGSVLDLKGRAGLKYTGRSDEDREAFVRKFIEFVEEFRRAHESRVRRQMRSTSFLSLSKEQQEEFRNSQPDWRAIWEMIPAMLAGDDSSISVAYDWWCAVYEMGGTMASNAWRTLKDTGQYDAIRGSVRCAPPPFHELDPGSTWSICRPVTADDADGVESSEWMTVGASVKGLTGVDGTEDTHYFWALRGFVAELEAKFLMKGKKEKQELLLAKPQTAEQDGLTFVKMCHRREAAVHSDKAVPDEVVRLNIMECVKLLPIKAD
ncbi:hypothetical protein CYMTET_47010 [Cymbomonas tetramitiformis]|uniref:Uncharacterized protein n=1 Tax=Cymbomonas tetramitiformis TaxID=36881 RepID=A0AAE0EY59_9CHLO|nr:hypothetical protein CYMTET_47010 [Cymbomonas tetramitiformis]